MLQCPNVFPWPSFYIAQERELLACLAHQIDNIAQLYPHCLRQKMCARAIHRGTS